MTVVRISAKADYAIRAAAELAGPDGAWKSADEVAHAQRIPHAFLAQILAELRTAEIVASRRGSDGGYRLLVPAATLTVADVLRAVEGPITQIAGGTGAAAPRTAAGCTLDRTWKLLDLQIRAVLESVTLADLRTGRLPDQVPDPDQLPATG
jgi:Rrf2 family protein